MSLPITLQAAVGLVLGVVDAITPTPSEREKLACALSEAAAEADEVTVRLTRLAAAAIRRG